MPAWFGSPSGYPLGYKDHDQVATLQEGRIIAMGKYYALFPAGDAFASGCEVINVRVPDLRMIDYVLEVQMHIAPLTCTEPIYEPVNKKITGNVVGMTIFGADQNAAAGTTLTVEVIAIGPY